MAPGIPHHITEQGNRRQQTFFLDDDYRAYLEVMAEWCSLCIVRSVGLLPDAKNVHLIVLPESEEEIGLLRRHERTGRPLIGDSFIDRLEKKSGRILRRQKPGPKLKQG